MSTGVGIGRKYWEDNKEFIKKYKYIQTNVKGIVKQKSIPRYFKKLWENEDWEDYHINRYEDIKKGIENQKIIINQEKYEKGIDENEIKWNKHLKKQERGLTEKAKSLKRNNFI